MCGTATAVHAVKSHLCVPHVPFHTELAGPLSAQPHTQTPDSACLLGASGGGKPLGCSDCLSGFLSSHESLRAETLSPQKASQHHGGPEIKKNLKSLPLVGEVRGGR